MINRFKEMIENGIAPSPVRSNVAPNDGLNGQDDRLCRTYNNIWSVLTDTHMAKPEGAPEGVEYVITGTFVARTKAGYREMDRFLTATNWGGASLPNSFSSILYNNGYEWKYGMLNNDEVVFIVKRPVADMPDPACDPCCGECDTTIA